jgi:hypothetical protein
VPATVVFVVYREAQLARISARMMLLEILADPHATLSDDPWPT